MALRLTAEQKGWIAHAIANGPRDQTNLDIATTFDTTEKTVRNIRNSMDTRRSSEPKKIGPPPKITVEIEEAVEYILAYHPYLYQDEISDFIDECFHVRLHQTTISKLLKRLEITQKRLKVEAAQRNQVLRRNWHFDLMSYTADQFVFVDESGSDERTGDRVYGYSRKGVPVTV